MRDIPPRYRVRLKCVKCKKLYNKRVKTRHPELCWRCNKNLEGTRQ